MVGRSSFTPNEKADIVLMGLKDPESISELCRRHDISPVTFSRWKKNFLSGGIEAMSPSSRTTYEDIQRENSRLKYVIGELYVELEYVKKKLGMGS
jgi:transposase-like protein